MKGLCYSALSYAPLFIDKEVIVIGGGELALRSAGELATVAKQVTMVCSNGDRTGSPLGQKLQAAGNVKIMKDCEIVEVQGDEYARKLIVKDASGELNEYTADGMFVEKALTPNTTMVKDLVKLDDQGRIIVDCGCNTNIPGIFAAGDVTNIYAEQVLIAVGEGAKAALSAYEYLLPHL
jgi:alkyl hydroperoxide reductase subunit AhpF